LSIVVFIFKSFGGQSSKPRNFIHSFFYSGGLSLQKVGLRFAFVPKDLPMSSRASFGCLPTPLPHLCFGLSPCWSLRKQDKSSVFQVEALLTLLGGSNCNKCLWKELYQQNDEKIVPLGPVKHSHPPLHPFSQSTWCFWIP